MTEISVRIHDLDRLLLEWRATIEADTSARWTHGADYDLSFERLADILDEATGVDERRRCKHGEPCYVWPEPVSVQAYNVRNSPATSATAKLRHLAASQGGSIYNALCGFMFTGDDVTWNPARKYPDCRTCERELGLRGNVTVVPSP